MIPDIIRRLHEQLPRKGGAPEPPPLAEVELIWDKAERKSGGGFWRGALLLALGAAAGAMGMAWQAGGF